MGLNDSIALRDTRCVPFSEKSGEAVAKGDAEGETDADKNGEGLKTSDKDTSGVMLAGSDGNVALGEGESLAANDARVEAVREGGSEGPIVATGEPLWLAVLIKGALGLDKGETLGSGGNVAFPAVALSASARRSCTECAASPASAVRVC